MFALKSASALLGFRNRKSGIHEFQAELNLGFHRHLRSVGIRSIHFDHLGEAANNRTCRHASSILIKMLL